MLFMYIHTHSAESCKFGKVEEVRKMASELAQAIAKAGVKPVATYTAVQEHTIYNIFEANDMTALQSILGFAPSILWGTGRLVPVIAASPPA